MLVYFTDRLSCTFEPTDQSYVFECVPAPEENPTPMEDGWEEYPDEYVERHYPFPEIGDVIVCEGVKVKITSKGQTFWA